MAYPRRIREAARRLWLLGNSDEKVVALLNIEYPDEPTPVQHQTIISWRKKENWEEDLDVVIQKIEEKETQKLIDEVASMNTRQVDMLSQLEAHIMLSLNRIRRGQDGKPIDTDLSPLEITHLTSALDKIIKNQRLIKNLTTENIQMDTDWKQDLIEIGIDPEHAIESTTETLLQLEPPETADNRTGDTDGSSKTR